jgi:hypothetical protein
MSANSSVTKSSSTRCGAQLRFAVLGQLAQCGQQVRAIAERRQGHRGDLDRADALAAYVADHQAQAARCLDHAVQVAADQRLAARRLIGRRQPSGSGDRRDGREYGVLRSLGHLGQVADASFSSGSDHRQRRRQHGGEHHHARPDGDGEGLRVALRREQRQPHDQHDHGDDGGAQGRAERRCHQRCDGDGADQAAGAVQQVSRRDNRDRQQRDDEPDLGSAHPAHTTSIPDRPTR